MILSGAEFAGAVDIAGSGFSFRDFGFRGFDSSCSNRATKREMVVEATFNPKFSARTSAIFLNEQPRRCNSKINFL